NDEDRILERQILIENNRYPSTAAKKKMD
ncbi:MAG: hypothetical protein RLZZ139_147, partial [Cyanobacteriota bacterium]